MYIFTYSKQKSTQNNAYNAKKLRSIYFTVCCLQMLTTEIKVTTSAFKKESCDATNYKKEKKDTEYDPACYALLSEKKKIKLERI